MAPLAGWANLVVLDGLVTQGDPAATASDVLAAEGAFRFGVASLYAVVVLDVVVAWALLHVFSPVSRGLSTLAAWFRLAYAGVLMVAVSQLAGVPDLLSNDASSDAFGAEQRQAQALLKLDTFHDIWFAGLVLFGAHLVLIGYLACRSAYIPSLVGVLLVLAGVGYAFDTFLAVLSQGTPIAVSMVTFLGEPLLALWLLIRGRHISLGTERHGL